MKNLSLVLNTFENIMKNGTFAPLENLQMLLWKMLQHSAILSTFIKLTFVTKIFALSIFELPFYIFHNIFKYMIFQRRQKVLLWSKWL